MVRRRKTIVVSTTDHLYYPDISLERETLSKVRTAFS
jgi:hypothetical protein